MGKTPKLMTPKGPIEDTDLCIYLIVRRDLKMGKGKIAAQCGHAVESLVLSCPRPLLKAYQLGSSSRKVCLGIKDLEEMETLVDVARGLHILHYKVVDAGLTQLEPGTTTVLGIGPVRPSTVQEIIGALKLL